MPGGVAARAGPSAARIAMAPAMPASFPRLIISTLPAIGAPLSGRALDRALELRRNRSTFQRGADFFAGLWEEWPFHEGTIPQTVSSP